MLHKTRIRLVVTAVSFALFASACNLGATATSSNGDCYVTTDYKISCPPPSPDLKTKVD